MPGEVAGSARQRLALMASQIANQGGFAVALIERSEAHRPDAMSLASQASAVVLLQGPNVWQSVALALEQLWRKQDLQPLLVDTTHAVHLGVPCDDPGEVGHHLETHGGPKLSRRDWRELGRALDQDPGAVAFSLADAAAHALLNIVGDTPVIALEWHLCLPRALNADERTDLNAVFTAVLNTGAVAQSGVIDVSPGADRFHLTLFVRVSEDALAPDPLGSVAAQAG